MGHYFAAVAIPLMLLSSFAWVALVSWCHIGKFRVQSSSPTRLEFRSDQGVFKIDHKHGTLAWKQAGTWRSRKLAEIASLDYLVSEGEALGVEFLMGFDFTDLFSRYRDTVEWHEIAAVSAGERIVLFRSGRLQRREFLFGWFIQLQETVLIRLGLLKDVEQQAFLALALLQSRLGLPPA